VPGVGRPTIKADIQGETTLLGPIVTFDAKALQSASQELVPVSAMRNDVIGHARRRHDAALQAQAAKRVGSELGTPKLAPAV